MATPTRAQVRSRWPYLTSARLSDDDLDDLISEAVDLARVGLSDSRDTTAKIHLTAHLALLRLATKDDLSAMISGPRSVNSASTRGRSVSFDLGRSSATQAAAGTRASLSGTEPGRQYLTLVEGLRIAAVSRGTAL